MGLPGIKGRDRGDADHASCSAEDTAHGNSLRREQGEVLIMDNAECPGQRAVPEEKRFQGRKNTHFSSP